MKTEEGFQHNTRLWVEFLVEGDAPGGKDKAAKGREYVCKKEIRKISTNALVIA